MNMAATATTTPDLVEARALFADLGQVHLVAIVPDGPTQGHEFGTDIEAALDWASDRNAEGMNVYFTVNSVKPGLHKKPCKQDITAARFVHVDIDPPKDGSPWNAEGAFAELSGLRCPPSLIIHSGGGIQAFWRLTEPVENWATIEVLNAGAVRLLKADKGTFNIDRLMRVPGFVNYPDQRKRARGRVEALARIIEPDDGVCYAVEELAQVFGNGTEDDDGNDEPAADPGDCTLLTPDDLGLGPLDPLRSAIKHPPGRDRSGDMLAAARLMEQRDFSDAQILGILINPANLVSAHAFDQRDPRRAALRVIQFVRNNPSDGRNEQTGQPCEPVDLWARYQEPPLPLGLLPDMIERFAVKQGGIMGADPAGLAMAALTVCAAAIPDRIALQVKRNDPTWQENARLWVALVGPPSRKKTPIFKAAIAPLRVLDNNLMRVFMQAQLEYEALSASDRKTAERPKQHRHLISDATVEAAQEVLRDSPDGVLSEQDELSGWFGAMDKYAPGKGAQADRGFWLKAFNGGTYNLNRIGRGASQISNLSISLLGGIQPEPIRKLAAETVDDGLVQRLLPVILRPADVGRDEPSDGVVVEYERLVGKLALMKPAMREGGFGHTEQPVHFSSGAKAIRERLEREHLDLVAALETASPKLSAHFGKYDGLFARLCLLWTCIEHADATMPPAEISEDVAARVATFMSDFIRPSAIAFYAGLLGMSAGHEDLVALAALIVAKGLAEVKARDAQRSTHSFRSMTADEFRLLCEKLEAFGWLDKAEPGPKSATPRWIVNPHVHELFADRAAQEAERRDAARNALKSALGG